MSKQRKKRGRPQAPARFKVGDRVRVRPGVRDEEHPDIPLGGWAGTISEVCRQSLHCVRWSRETISRIHPICKKRCAIDGTYFEEYWLEDDDLEPDPGGPLSLEQPTEIVPRPLSNENQGDRVRMVFGLTSDDFLPEADEDSLETYYDYLHKRLSLPFQTRYDQNEEGYFSPSRLRWGKVVALGSGETDLDEDQGIFCRIRGVGGEEIVLLTELRLRRSDSNYQLIDDYATWFCGELSEDMDDDEDDEESAEDEEYEEDEEASRFAEAATWRGKSLLLLEIAAFATSFGAVVGAAVAVMPWARWAACIGGGVWGVLMAVAWTASADRKLARLLPRTRKTAGAFIGLILGAIQGALFGIMAVAFIGAVLGGIAGFALKQLVRGKRWLVLRIFPRGVLFAVACGVAAQAFYMDRVQATTGLRYGAALGLGGGLLICLVALPLSVLLVRLSDS